MGKETEHKYLVVREAWEKVRPARGEHIRQGYLKNEPALTIRVRIRGKRAYLTIKGKTEGATRDEYELKIPMKEADELLQNFCGNLIEKKRYKIRYRRKTWEIDEFEGSNCGLLMAEIELNSENEKYRLPPWIGAQVTDDNRFYNAYLADHPFNTWPAEHQQ